MSDTYLPPKRNNMKPSTANLLLLLAGAIWGLGFIAQQTAMQDISPMVFVAARFLLAGFCVLPLAVHERRKARQPLSPRHLVQCIGVGFVFFLAMSLQQIGLLRTTVTNAGFLTVLYVVIVPLICVVFLKEKLSLVIWITAACSVVGVYLLSSGKISNLNWGDGCVILAACSWAIHVIIIGKVTRGTGRPISMACIQFFACGVFGVIAEAVLLTFGFSERLPTATALSGAGFEILYAGIVSGGIAFTLQAVSQRYTSSSIAAILMASESLFAALFGAILLHERLNMTGYVGCGLIFVSIVTSEWWSRQQPDDSISMDAT